MMITTLQVLKNVPISNISINDVDRIPSSSSSLSSYRGFLNLSYFRDVITVPSTEVVSTAASGIALLLLYIISTNLFYLWRRATLRDMSMYDIFRIRITREPGVSKQLYVLFLLAWQVLVGIFPITELVARLFGYASFLYSYPNANGCGYILEPLDVQNSPANIRAKQQYRLDWHRFKYNVGEIGRNGYRHPPSVIRNLPHIDIPQKSMKHWPWKRCHHQKNKSIDDVEDENLLL